MDKNLIKWLDKSNLVDTILNMKGGKEKLVRIGAEVVLGDTTDRESMSDWTDVLKEGIDLLKPDNKAKDYPWEHASNYKSPVIAEAVRDFGDKYCTQILGKPDLVAGSLEGDTNQEKEDVIDRVLNHMNYQLNTEIKFWRDEQKSLGYQLSAQGTLFKKTWYDPAAGHNVSEIISYPYFSVDNECNSMNDIERFTQRKYYSPNDIVERTQSDVWSELKMPEKSEENKDQYMFLEQMCSYDLDDDGYEEPYLVTVHEQSSTVVRVVARWNTKGIMVEYEGVVMSYDEMQYRVSNVKQSPLQDNKQFNEFKEDKVKGADKSATLISIKPVDMLTKYGFINPANGTLLDYGFCHIMISGIKGINKSTNSLFNSGDLSNLQGGFLSKDHRTKRKGITPFKPGMWKQTNINSMDLQNSILSLPIKEPSQTLFNLNEGLKVEVKEQGTKVNIQEMMSPNIPATSVLGMLQEGSIPTSALMDGMVTSMSHEFKIMFDLNKEFTDPITYKRVNDGEGDYEADYGSEIIIKPTANAKFSSQQQNIQMAMVQLEQVPLVLQTGANPIPIIKNFFKAIESDLTEEIFSQEVPPEEQKQMDEMKKLQEQQTAAQQKQADMLELQTKLMTREQDLNERESAIKSQQEDEKIRLQSKKQNDDFNLKLIEMEENYNKRLDDSVVAHDKLFSELKLKYDTLDQTTRDKAQDRVVPTQ